MWVIPVIASLCFLLNVFSLCWNSFVIDSSLSGCCYLFARNFWAKEGFPGGSDSKESACSVGGPGLIHGSRRSLEEGMATHSSIHAWRIPWTEEPGGLPSMTLKELDITQRLTLWVKGADIIILSSFSFHERLLPSSWPSFPAPEAPKDARHEEKLN